MSGPSAAQLGVALTVAGMLIALDGIYRVLVWLRRAPVEAAARFSKAMRRGEEQPLRTVTSSSSTKWSVHKLALDPLPLRPEGMTDAEWLSLAVEHVHRQEQSNSKTLDAEIVRATNLIAEARLAVDAAIATEVGKVRTEMRREGKGLWLIVSGSVLQIVGAIVAVAA